MSEVDGQNEMFAGASVSNLEDGDILASLSAWARCIGISRETLQDRLLEATVVARGKRLGYPIYAGRDVLAAWLSGPESRLDPDALPPFQRRAWYQGEHEKLKLQADRGELVPAIEVEQTIGKVAKLFVMGLDTLIDTIEREVGLTPLQASKMEQHVDRLRENLYQAVVEDPDAPPAPPPKVEKPKPPKKPATPAGSVLEEAVQFLVKALKPGQKPTAKLVALAKESGISEGTLRRAKAQLGAEVVASRQGKGWVWSMASKKAKSSKKRSKRKT